MQGINPKSLSSYVSFFCVIDLIALQIVEKREKEIKELKVEIGRSNSTSPNGIMTQKKGGNGAIWLNPKFRLLASLSAAVLLFCAKR